MENLGRRRGKSELTASAASEYSGDCDGSDGTEDWNTVAGDVGDVGDVGAVGAVGSLGTFGTGEHPFAHRLPDLIPISWSDHYDQSHGQDLDSILGQDLELWDDWVHSFGYHNVGGEHEELRFHLARSEQIDAECLGGADAKHCPAGLAVQTSCNSAAAAGCRHSPAPYAGLASLEVLGAPERLRSRAGKAGYSEPWCNSDLTKVNTEIGEKWLWKQWRSSDRRRPDQT